MPDVLIMSKEQMATLGTDFMARGQQVLELQQAVTALLEGTTWDGARARQFREAWSSEFAPSLTKLVAALNENGTLINKERSNAMLALDGSA